MLLGLEISNVYYHGELLGILVLFISIILRCNYIQFQTYLQCWLIKCFEPNRLAGKPQTNCVFLFDCVVHV